MYRRARRLFLAAALTLTPQLAAAQPPRQPTPVPLVTAENEPWFRDATPIQWSGELYHPAGAPRAFDPYAMAPVGSYHGIPLYSDTTVAPYTILFVPTAGSRMQPYEQLPTGITPSPVATTGTINASAAPPGPIATTGRAINNGPVTTAIPPKGVNNAWIQFDGRRWVAGGKAVERTPDMREIGEYRGFTVYERGGDRSTIYVPSTADLVVPFVKR